MRVMKEEKGLGLSQKGFTLIELLVALVLSFILIGAIYGTFTAQQKAYSIQDQVAEAQQNARMAMNILLRDIRMAGYGMPDLGIIIGGTTYSNAIMIKKEGNYKGNYQSFDSITLVGAFGSPSGYLDRTIPAGSTTIYLRSPGEASEFNTTNNRYIFIGGIDKLTVTDVSGNRVGLNGSTSVRYPTAILSAGLEGGETDIHVIDADGLASGDVLGLGTETVIIDAVSDTSITVDTDPETAGNQGISGSYPAGTIINPIPVFRVTAVEYAVTVDPYTGSPVLVREDKAVVAGGGEAADLAGNILDIQIDPDDLNDRPFYDLTLTAQTRKRDPDYTPNQGRRQRILQSRIALRNPLP